MDESKKSEAFQIGLTVITLLGVFTIGEYLLGVIAIDWWMPLLIIGLFKAFFVVRDYMHLPRLFASEEESH
jgi:hypothetical protein